MDTKPGSSPASVPVATIEHDHSKLERFVENNAKGLLIALAGVFLAVCAFFVVQFLRARAESDAARAFTSADTVEALRSTAAGHSGKVAAGSALLELADRLWKEDKAAESREALESFLSSYPNHPRRHAAFLALAIQDQAAGNYDEADENLRKAKGSNVPADIDQLARIRLADLWVARAIQAKNSGDTEAPTRLVREAAASYDELMAGKLPAYYIARIEDNRSRLNLIAPGAVTEEQEAPSTATPLEEAPSAPEESTPAEVSPPESTPPSEPGDPAPEASETEDAGSETGTRTPRSEEVLPDTPEEDSSSSEAETAPEPSDPTPPNEL